MRICLISREYPPDTGWGGVGAYTYQSANALKKLGHDVEVISLTAESVNTSTPNKTRLTSNGITIHRVEWEEAMEELNLLLISAESSHLVLKSGIAIWKKFIELHGQNPFDVVEAPEHLAQGFFQSITKVSPLVLTLHTPHSKFVAENFHNVSASFDNQFICMLERLAMVEADLLLAPSEDLAGFVSSDTGIALDDIQIVRNPVNTQAFCPKGKRAIQNNNNIRVMFVGRLEERKGVQHFVRAIPSVLKENRNIEFLIVGNDTNTADNGTSMKAHLEKELKASGCLDSVTFVSHVPLHEMPEYYRSADISVIPSLYDNAPYTCIEALASGNPVIVSSFGGTKEYVVENVTGLVVPGANPDALKEAILSIANDEKKRSTMSKAARQYAVSVLDTTVYADNKIALYEQAIQNFYTRVKRPIYNLPVHKALNDSVEILCALDQTIFDVLYNQSIEFRVKHWLRLLKTRPKLALGHLTLATLKTIRNTFGLKNHKFATIENLERSIAERTPPPYEATRKWGTLPLSISKPENKAIPVEDREPVTSVNR